MIKKLLVLAALLGGCSSLYAQKYLTRNGRLTFYSATPIENIEAFNNDVAAVLDAGAGNLVVQAPIKSFHFEKALMQEHFNDDYMESNTYPKADFKGLVDGQVDYSKNGIYKVKANGKLTIHGVTREVTIPGTITVKDGTMTLDSKFKVKTEDYKIKIPSVASSKIAKEIEVTLNTVLKAK